METAVYESPIGPMEIVASEKGIISVKFLFGRHGCEESQDKRNSVKGGGRLSENEVLVASEPNRHLVECTSWLGAYFSGALLEMDDPPSKPALVLPEKSNVEPITFKACAVQLLEGKNVFHNPLIQFSIIIAIVFYIHLGEFYNTAWRALLDTEVGDTITYKELAQQAGRPLAARAVGQAVKSHSLPILVPCHRVVPSGKRKPQEETRKRKSCTEENAGNYSGGDGPPTKKWLLEHEQKMSKEHPH